MSAPPPTRRLMHRPYLLLVLTTLFWGGNVVAGKAAVGHIGPYLLMLLRWSAALVLLAPFAVRPLRTDWPVIRRRWWLFLLYGVVGYAAFNVLVYVAAYFTSGVNVAIDQVAINIFVMAINFTLFRTRVRALQLFGVLLSIVGVALTATHGDLVRLGTLDINFGDLLILLACLAYALYSVSLRWRPKTGWLSFLFASFVGAAVASVVLELGPGGGMAAMTAELPQVSPLGWLIVGYTAVFPSILSQMFYVRGVELIGANRASLFINLIPLFGALGSVVVLGEQLQPFHIVAAALIAAGIALFEWSARRN